MKAYPTGETKVPMMMMAMMCVQEERMRVGARIAATIPAMRNPREVTWMMSFPLRNRETQRDAASERAEMSAARSPMGEKV